jgi:hypothetical protein
MMAAKVNRVAALEVFQGQWRNIDRFSLEFIQGLAEALEIIRLCQDGEVHIPAKIRRAVEYAGLTAHQ